MAAVLVAMPGRAFFAQEATSVAARPEVTFHFERAAVAVPRYSLTIFEDGSGVYQGDAVSLGTIETAGPMGSLAGAATQPFREPVSVAPATAKRIFSMTKSLKNFNISCASKAKNVADTGTKTLSYKGSNGQGECTYNYSENKTVVQVADLFLGVAETMDEGRRLDHLHRYDRLGLDAAINSFATEVSEGRAVELGTIAGTLRSIAADTEVMQRVRLKASQLLSLLPPEMQRTAAQ